MFALSMKISQIAGEAQHKGRCSKITDVAQCRVAIFPGVSQRVGGYGVIAGAAQCRGVFVAGEAQSL